jgi:hypothetical protein
MIASSGSRILRTAGAVALIPLMVQGAASADTVCRTVRGSYVERAVPGPDCDSPVGLCIEGTYRGDIRGSFEGRATSLVATADTPATSVQLFTSDSSITAALGGRRGTIVIKNAGAFSAASDGSIVDLQRIVGGTGDFAGATGALRAEGTFSFATGGTSTWKGEICLR